MCARAPRGNSPRPTPELQPPSVTLPVPLPTSLDILQPPLAALQVPYPPPPLCNHPPLCNPPPPLPALPGDFTVLLGNIYCGCFVLPICHTHVLALLSHDFKSVTYVYSVIFSLQRWCTGCPRCFLPATGYGTTHARLVHMCWPLLWGLEIPLQSPPPPPAAPRTPSLGDRPPPPPMGDHRAYDCVPKH